MKIYIFILFLLQQVITIGQNKIEFLLLWDGEESISILGLMAEETSDGDYLLLGNIQGFQDTPDGILIEGPITLGTGIVKLTNNGQEVWRNFYATNDIIVDDLYSRGRVSGGEFILNSSGHIVLPYSILAGILYCDSINSNTAAYSFKKGILNIDNETGNIIQDQRFLNDFLCDQDKIIGIKETDFGYILLYYDDFYHNPLYIEKLNFDFEVLQIDTFENDTKWIQFSEQGDQIIIASQTGFFVIDYEANILQNYTINLVDTLFSTTIKWAENADFYVFGMTDYSYPERVSTLYVLDKQNNNTISTAFFDDKIINDVELTDDNEVLVLFDLSRNDFYDTIALPVQITQFDLMLNQISSKKYGFRFISPIDITLTNDQSGFLVTGTRLKSFDLVNGQEADQLYFLKDQLSSLITNINERQEAQEIKIFPNPTSNFLTIDFPKNTESIDDIHGKIVDNLGKEIQSITFTSTIQTINLEKIPPGLYYLEIELSNRNYVEKLIIVK